MTSNSTITIPDIAEFQHPEFYLPDGSCIFAVEGVLYKLPASLLSKHSAIFQLMYTLPAGVNVEGKLDDNPIVLQGIRSIEFDHLLQFLFQIFKENETESKDYLMSLLKLSMLWDIKVGRDYAIDRLSHHKDIDPSLKIHLAQKYDIDEWIAPTFRQLVLTNHEDIGNEEILLMGIDVYRVLMQTKLRLQIERLYIAYSAPDVVHTDTCPNTYGCRVDWDRSWWNGFCRHLLHPNRLLTCEAALSKLEAARLSEMTGDCLVLTVKGIRMSGVLEFWERIIDEAIEEILCIQVDRRNGRIVQPQVNLKSDAEATMNVS